MPDSGYEIGATPEMIEAGCAVSWVRAFQGEFEGFDAEHDAIMREHVKELWEAMVRHRIKGKAQET